MEHKRAYESVILTGFQTFGSHTKNPTEELITSISEEEMKAHRILKKMALDVTCKDVDCFTSDLTKELDKIKPGEQVLLIHMGVGPNQIYHLEQCAYNNMDFSIPDNSGYQPIKQQICNAQELDCPLKTKLNLKELQKNLESHKVRISSDPGRYLCNYIYYNTMKNLGCRDNVTCLFVHFPTNKHTAHQQNKEFLLALIDKIQNLPSHHH